MSQLASVIEAFPPFGHFESGGTIARRAGKLLKSRGSKAGKPEQNAWRLIEQHCPGYSAFKGPALFDKDANGNIGLRYPKAQAYAHVGERPRSES